MVSTAFNPNWCVSASSEKFCLLLCFCVLCGCPSIKCTLTDIILTKTIHASYFPAHIFPNFNSLTGKPDSPSWLSLQRATCSRFDGTLALPKARWMTSFISLCRWIRAELYLQDRPWWPSGVIVMSHLHLCERQMSALIRKRIPIRSYSAYKNVNFCSSYALFLVTEIIHNWEFQNYYN